MKRKVGIIGGTFNPIHTGHLILAEAAYEAFDLDEVLFVPTGISNLKDPSIILDKTSFAWGLVAEAIHIFVLGNNMHLTTQNNAVNHVFPCPLEARYI